MTEVNPFNRIPKTEDPGNRLTMIAQVGLVVSDLDKVMRALENMLGVKPDRLAIVHPNSGKYRGQDADYQARIAWYGFANIELEFIQPLSGESIWSDHLKENNTALHHIRFNVKDYEAAVRGFANHGMPVYQSGKVALDPRFKWAYFDSEPVLGFVAEILSKTED